MLNDFLIMIRCKYFLIFAMAIQFVSPFEDLDISLDYSIGGRSFQPFGTARIKANLDGSHAAEFVSDSADSIKRLMNSLESNPGGKDYQLRCGHLYSTNSVEAFVSTEFAHLIEITIDSDNQKVLSVTHRPATRSQQNDSAIQLEQFPIAIRIRTTSDLPGPDTASYLHRMEEEKKARQQGATQDNRSFLQKYWIYFVPVVLFMVLSNAFNQEPAEG